MKTTMMNMAVKYMGFALGAAVLLAGCGSAKDTTADATATPDVMTGGYTVNENLKAVTLPEEAQKAFDKALANIEGATYEPIALIGTQVVSGTNYAILCKVTPVVTNAVSELDVVTVYEDLSGNAEILSTETFDLATVTGIDQTYTVEEGMAGGVTANVEFTAQDADDATMKVFEEAKEEAAKKNGGSYSFAAMLGSQSVAGTNYAFLALKDGDDAENARWAVLTVYEDLSGKVSLSSVYELDPGAYTSYDSAP